MKWDRTTVKTVAIVFVTIIATSFFIKWTFDHDGETISLGGEDTPGQTTRPTASTTVRSGDTDPVSGLPWILEEDLPVEGQATLVLIDRGGPFPFPDRDGSVFRNLEGLLPDHERGYYHEYTVATPGSKDRGARRIITGDADEFYWTEDHYSSFERISRRPT
ncbi:MAG TPA: ribonuclease domain-containing protein [Nocardioides sp.]|uniref:ribonuclease domain-containing protein n=1 Tax=Nocardioides sp. TaxID=35761 RepID=UPI002E32EDC8|nr:ribonuclease domain-containing protein [Nocardioides sp.]HEX5086484.1 ribonuclease domain-containing protein [Nocardioides sp.]